ncbi:twin arginine-targeting protein translocase TatB [Beggiatoa alba B18LD]|uniref:Sec-independent protein translocase protein TatB n=1 Tax=Beggiatoa alba B18LD TaxID=395493 RepID=I3CEK6_9GAMM|nr:Sec-independent protein translocase protein TatB [Beggiatoa alba]EIJ42049.1 twin arginine-targeting protein translocase TatB [Beggiatoa alba B18LD]
MFEIGFWELVLIGVIALLVIGPDKLPSAARTAGLWIGKMRRFVTSIKDEVDRELRLQELQQQLKEVEKNNLQPLVDETRKTALDVQNTLNQVATDTQPTNNTPEVPSPTPVLTSSDATKPTERQQTPS